MAKISFNKTAASAPAPEAEPTKAPAKKAAAKVNTIKEKVPTPDPDVEVETVTTVADEDNAKPTTAVARRQPSAPPAPRSGFGFSDSAEDIDFSEINVPKINVVQKVGGLSEQFEPGEIVLNKELVLPQPIRLVVLAMSSTQFVEQIPGGEMGNLFNTIEEVTEAGGTVLYDKAKADDIPLYKRMKRALLMVEKHDDVEDEDSFPYEHDGKRYALAVMSLKGRAYTNGAKPLLTERKTGWLKAGYASRVVTLSAKVEQSGKFFSAVPRFKKDEETTPEFRAFTAETLNGSSDE